MSTHQVETFDTSNMSDNQRPSLDPPTAQAKHVTLLVGERLFITARQILERESCFFTSLFSGRWDSAVLPDGSYFVDADPGLFEHILRDVVYFQYFMTSRKDMITCYILRYWRGRGTFRLPDFRIGLRIGGISLH